MEYSCHEPHSSLFFSLSHTGWFLSLTFFSIPTSINKEYQINCCPNKVEFCLKPVFLVIVSQKIHDIDRQFHLWIFLDSAIEFLQTKN
jgi:hypothetical protein